MRSRLAESAWLPVALALALATGAAIAFTSIAEDVVTRDSIVGVDARLAAWIPLHRTPARTELMRAVSAVHGTIGISLLALGCAVLLWRRKELTWLIALSTALPGGMLLNVLLKHLFQRPRPALEASVIGSRSLDTFSFPSGHSAEATVFYGLLAAFLIARVPGLAGRVAILVGAIALASLVAFSRLYLGVHYLSDVLAGALEGLAWLTFCIAVVFRPRALH